MNCTEFQTAVATAVECRRRPGSGVAAHLDHCRNVDCRACWDDALLLDRAIQQWRRSQPAIDIADSVVTQCQLRAAAIAQPVSATASPALRSASATPRRWTAAMAAVAAMLLAAVLLFSPPGDSATTRLALREDAGRVDRHTTAVEEMPTVPDAKPVAGLTYVAYAQNAAQVVTDAVVLTLGNRDEMENPTISPPGFGWEPSWPPISDDMDAALEDILESLPSDAPPS